MRKLMVIVALGTLLLGFNGGMASADLINTGPAPIGGANYAVAAWEYSAGEFMLTETTTITSIEGWMRIIEGGVVASFRLIYRSRRSNLSRRRMARCHGFELGFGPRNILGVIRRHWFSLGGYVARLRTPFGARSDVAAQPVDW
jgi:hypothetical protein